MRWDSISYLYFNTKINWSCILSLFKKKYKNLLLNNLKREITSLTAGIMRMRATYSIWKIAVANIALLRQNFRYLCNYPKK